MCTKRYASYVGIDLHKQSLVLASLGREREVQTTQRIATKCVDKIEQTITSLPRPIACVIESVGMYEWLWELLEGKVDHLVLADATEVKRRRKRGRAKTDRNDALHLAHLLYTDNVPACYVPDKSFRTMRKLGRHYHRLSRMLASVKVQMRWLLNQHNARGPKSLSAASATRWLLAHGQKLDDSSLFAYKQYLEIINRLEADKATTVREMRLIAKDERFRQQLQLIKTVPGIGDVISFIVNAEIADFSRFHSGDAIASYTGLTPRSNESGGKSRQEHISKCGNPTLRWALVEAATTLIASDRKYKAMHERIASNKGTPTKSSRQVAKVAIAQKLVRYLRKMVKTGEPFRKGEPTDRQAKLNRKRLGKKSA